MTTNYLTLYEGLKIFRDAMLPFIVEKLQAVYGDQWWEQGVARGFKPEDIERLRVQFEKRHDSLVVERPGEELAETFVSLSRTMLDVNWFGNILESKRRYRRVVIRTPVRWENWQDFYNEVIDPLIREGADIDIQVEVNAEGEGGIRENTVELGIRESLFQRGMRAEIEVE